MASLIPNRANAFWFFSVGANAAGSMSAPNASTPTLKAATNVDPNPNKGLGDGIQTSDNAVLAYAGPSGTIADVASSTSPGRISLYVIRPGDTLSEIADMFGVSVNTIIWANNLRGAKDVHVGDTLVILPVSGAEHVVVKGDTLKSVAKKYNADANEIAQYNGLDSSAALVVGSSIIIPGGEIAPVVVTVKSPTKKKGFFKKVINEPYLGGGGSAQPGFYGDPVPGGLITQGIHGWNAVDIGAARGTPILAAASGVVIVARSNGAWNGAYGNYVVITHSNDTQTLYAHMSHATVSSGESVQKGEIIGYVGMTGMTTGPHVHFEVRGAANPFRNCEVDTVCAPQ